MAAKNKAEDKAENKSQPPDSNVQYTCDICGEDSLGELEMRAHVLIEHVDGQPSCPFCDLEGTTAEEMTLHVNAEHLEFLGSPTKSKSSDNADVADSGNFNSIGSNGSSNLSHKNSVMSDRSYSSASTAVCANGSPVTSDKPKSPICHISSKRLKMDFDQHDQRSRLFLKITPTVKCSKFIDTKKVDSDQLWDRTEAHPSSLSSAGLDEDSTWDSAASGGYHCPLCTWTTSCETQISEHVNREHFDSNSPHIKRSKTQSHHSTSTLCDNQYECPLCGFAAEDGSTLESHVHSIHQDVLSPSNSCGNMSASISGGSREFLHPNCPVCGMECTDSDSLMLHVDTHFSAENTPDGTQHNDSLLALELEQQEREGRKFEEEKQFSKLQEMHGMKGDGNYREQADRQLEKAVYKGELTIADFYSHKLDVQQASLSGVEDGHSCTKSVIAKLQSYYKTCNTINAHHLCSDTSHYAVSYGDKGWGCGYRNLQMMLSCLASDASFQQVLFNGRPLMPSIPKIQRLIEAAWQKGFDVQGQEQLGGVLVNTTKWIGATDIVATMSSLRVECQLIDFHAPTGRGGTHPRLFDWVKAYFKRNDKFKPPLYLQHQGHSRTIVGIEEHNDGNLRLLVFDPSTSQKQMQQFLHSINTNLMRTLRRGMYALRAKQYQIVAVTGILPDKRYDGAIEVATKVVTLQKQGQ